MREVLQQIELPELDHGADFGIELPDLAALPEILDQELYRQAALHLELAEQPGAGFFQHGTRQVGGDDLGAPAGELFAHLLQHHRDRIGLLPGRTGRAPDAQRFAAGARLQQFWDQLLAQMIERQLVAEEERLVGGHRLDHVGGERLGARTHLLHQLGNTRQIETTRQRQQPAFDQVTLLGGQIEPGAVFQKLAQKIEISRGHERSPANTRATLLAI